MKRIVTAEADWPSGVAAMHLTLSRLRVTVSHVDLPANSPCATCSHPREHSVPPTAALALLVFSPAAQAASPLELNFWLSGPRYDGRVAECERALSTIASQFQEKEGKFWNSALGSPAFGRIHETAFRPWQSDNIPRRFCSGEVMLSDGKMRTVHYSIFEDGGFAPLARGSNGA